MSSNWYGAAANVVFGHWARLNRLDYLKFTFLKGDKLMV